MRPHIEYRSGADNAEMVCEFFPGLKPEDLPDGKGWSWEKITLVIHNGTHLDAPYHFQPVDKEGDAMMTIDEVPLDWCFRPGVKLDFRKMLDGHVVTAQEVEDELARIGHDLQPFDIVLVNTRASECYGTPEYLTAGAGMGREASLYLTERSVRLTGIDAWGWDAPFSHTRERWLETKDPSTIWEGHYAGIDTPYCHLENSNIWRSCPVTVLRYPAFPARLRPPLLGEPGQWRCLIREERIGDKKIERVISLENKFRD